MNACLSSFLWFLVSPLWWFEDSYLRVMLCWCLMNVTCRVCCLNVLFGKLMGFCYETLFPMIDVMVCIFVGNM